MPILIHSTGRRFSAAIVSLRRRVSMGSRRMHGGSFGSWKISVGDIVVLPTSDGRMRRL
jgi:hypothetical protein